MHHHARVSRQRAGWLAAVCAALLLAAAPLPAAEEQDNREKVKEGAREVGHTIGSVFREIGHGTRDFFKAIGHGTRDAVKAVGEAASEGGSAFKRGIKGEGVDQQQGAAPATPPPQGSGKASGQDH